MEFQLEKSFYLPYATTKVLYLCWRIYGQLFERLASIERSWLFSRSSGLLCCSTFRRLGPEIHETRFFIHDICSSLFWIATAQLIIRLNSMGSALLGHQRGARSGSPIVTFGRPKFHLFKIVFEDGLEPQFHPPPLNTPLPLRLMFNFRSDLPLQNGLHFYC